MLTPKQSRRNWLTCLLLTFSICVVPLAGVNARVARSSAQRGSDNIAAPNLKALSQYGVDLTELARVGKLVPVSDYDAQIRQTMRTLARETKNNPVLLSDDGAARSATVEGVAQRIADGTAPANLLKKRLFSLSLESLSAGVADSAEFNARFEAVLSEAKSAQGGIILFIDGLDALVAEDDSVNASAANLLEAALAHDELRLIGAATPELFEAKLAQREGFKGKLQEIFIDAVSEDTAKASDEKDEANETVQNRTEAFVGRKNRARAFYRKAGFRFTSVYDTIFLQQKLEA